MNDWAHIRLSRSSPPGRAATDDVRRETYSAALQQSEELFRGARTATSASRPLPLFYSLSQAGRAIAAAHAEKWQLRGHGLSMDITDDDPMTSIIQATKAGAFVTVAELTGDGLTSPVPLQEVWAAIPSLADTPAPTTSPPSLYAEPVEDEYPFSSLEHGVVQATVVFPSEVEEQATHHLFLERYPTPWPREVTLQACGTQRGYGRVVRWGTDALTPLDRRSRLEELLTRDAATGDRWLVPGIGRSQEVLAPLFLWWILLYGFSILARYEPGHWKRILDVDSSRWAVAVESALDIALETLPSLILQGLTGA